jgi:hypothetical protein
MVATHKISIESKRSDDFNVCRPELSPDEFGCALSSMFDRNTGWHRKESDSERTEKGGGGGRERELRGARDSVTRTSFVKRVAGIPPAFGSCCT